jgi:hypothetical protein
VDSLPDQVALELGQRSEDVEVELDAEGGSVILLGQPPMADPPLGEDQDNLDQRQESTQGQKEQTDQLATTARLRWRKRQGSVSSRRHDTPGTEPIDIAAAAPRRVSGQSKRTAYHAPRRRKLSSEQEAAIRSEASNRSLRDLVTVFGVSHETIRSVLHQESPALAKIR